MSDFANASSASTAPVTDYSAVAMYREQLTIVRAELSKLEDDRDNEEDESPKAKRLDTRIKEKKKEKATLEAEFKAAIDKAEERRLPPSGSCFACVALHWHILSSTALYPASAHNFVARCLLFRVAEALLLRDHEPDDPPYHLNQLQARRRGRPCSRFLHSSGCVVLEEQRCSADEKWLRSDDGCRP